MIRQQRHLKKRLKIMQIGNYFKQNCSIAVELTGHEIKPVNTTDLHCTKYFGRKVLASF